MQKTSNPFDLTYSSLKVKTKNLVIRCFEASDCVQWLAVRSENYEYLQEREPIWDMDALTYNGYFRLLTDLKTAFFLGNYYSLGIFNKETQELIGGIEIGNILGWPKQSATIGYWISEQQRGQGYATEVVANISKWAIKTFNLVKVEAGTMVSNKASQRVLDKAGFSKEGISHRYAEINGIYHDHILWGITSEEINPALISLQS
jgi:ribosomal-protein-alanine N-acetyltransferase